MNNKAFMWRQDHPWLNNPSLDSLKGNFNAETVFLGNFTSLNKYILQQYTEEIKFTQGKDWLGFDILLLSNIYQGPRHSKE